MLGLLQHLDIVGRIAQRDGVARPVAGDQIIHVVRLCPAKREGQKAPAAPRGQPVCLCGIQKTGKRGVIALPQARFAKQPPARLLRRVGGEARNFGNFVIGHITETPEPTGKIRQTRANRVIVAYRVIGGMSRRQETPTILDNRRPGVTANCSTDRLNFCSGLACGQHQTGTDRLQQIQSGTGGGKGIRCVIKQCPIKIRENQKGYCLCHGHRLADHASLCEMPYDPHPFRPVPDCSTRANMPQLGGAKSKGMYPMSLFGNWSYPTAIRFGAGRIAELAETCQALGIARPLLVTDRGLAGLDITQNALDILDGAGLGRAMFAEVDPNPTELNLDAGIAAYRAGDHDGVIAFGGGSALDLGKMVAFMHGQARPVWDFEDIGDFWTRADADVIAPIIAVPTTAGTGSEVGRASVLTNAETHRKKIIFHPKVLPSIVICDPELTVGMPPAITAGTGLDAFAHCVEAFSSPHFHPMSQGIALEGMRLVKEYLPRAYEDGTDIEARAQMMSAASMGATAFQKGLGAIHAMSHPVGARFGTHHGTTNAVCMPAVLALNAPEIADKFDTVSAYLGLSGGFDGFRAFVAQLNDSLGVPRGLATLGVTEDAIPDLVRDALDDPSCGGNPVTLDTQNLESLFRSAL